MTETAQTAAEAYARDREAFEHDALIQGAWHSERDGRQLACGLGVLGANVKSANDCPASIMPRWLAQLVPWFFDNQTSDDAKNWGLAFYEQLDRLNGVVPFSVVHDWNATIVGPLAIEVAEKLDKSAKPHKALASMHSDALAGKKFSADEWRSVVRVAYAYADADAVAYAYADADADACAYADANANRKAAYQFAIKLLADGMVECLARVHVAA